MLVRKIETNINHKPVTTTIHKPQKIWKLSKVSGFDVSINEYKDKKNKVALIFNKFVINPVLKELAIEIELFFNVWFSLIKWFDLSLTKIDIIPR